MLWKFFLGVVASFFIVIPIVHAEEFFVKDFKYGARGDAVIELQEFLTDEKVYTGPISGSFYSLTRIAIRKFQKREKIKQTGVWDKKTRERANAIVASGTTEESDDKKEETRPSRPASDSLPKQPAAEPVWPWLQPTWRITSTPVITPPTVTEPVNQPSRTPAILKPFVQPIVDFFMQTPSTVPTPPATSTASSTPPQTVITTPTSPTVTTNPATNITTSTATLNGLENANGGSVSAWFRYSTINPGTCNDTFGTGTPRVAYGSISTAYSKSVSGLLPGTTYYYCALASSAAGTGFGAIRSFTTLTTLGSVQPPLNILNFSVIYPSPTSATLSWSSGRDADASVDCSAVRSSAQAAGSDPTISINHSITLIGLASGAEYRCMITSGAGGSVSVFYNIFTPSAPVVPSTPTVVTHAASLVATTYLSSSATLNGSANPNGKPTTGWFYYSQFAPADGICGGAWINHSIRAPASGSIDLGSGVNPVFYSVNVAGLDPNYPHTYCAFASNGSDTSWGAIVPFTTPPATQAPPGSLPPTVVTNDPVVSSESTANMKASVGTNGLPTTAWFRYSVVNPGTCNDSFGTTNPPGAGGGLGNNIIGSGTVTYTGFLQNLTSGATYYYCAIAHNLAGTTYGNLVSFVAGLPEPTTVPNVTTQAPGNGSLKQGDVTYSSVQLNGRAPHSGPTISTWFRYSTVNPGICNNTFGTPTAVRPYPATFDNTFLGFSYSVNYLPTGTTYYYCAIAENSVGTGFGDVVSFTTVSSANTTVSGAAPQQTRVAMQPVAPTSFWRRLAGVLYQVITFPARSLGF